MTHIEWSLAKTGSKTKSLYYWSILFSFKKSDIDEYTVSTHEPISGSVSPSEYNKNKILQDYALLESQIDLPSTEPAVHLSVKRLCDRDWVFPTTPRGGATFNPILQKRKVRLREYTGQGHTAKEGQIWDSRLDTTWLQIPQNLTTPHHPVFLTWEECSRNICYVNKKREKRSNSQFHLTRGKKQ